MEEEKEKARQEQARLEQVRLEQEQEKTNFVKENDLEPALEKLITQVIHSTSDNETPGTKFEQMVGPTIEKLVRKILESDHPTDESENGSISDKSINFDDVYDHDHMPRPRPRPSDEFQVDFDDHVNETRRKTIRNSLRPNDAVNPLYNKKERDHMPLNSRQKECASVDMECIYNEDGTKYYENELRSQEYINKRWFTFGNGVQKDAITAIYVDPVRKIIIICGLFRSINRSEVQNIAQYNYKRKEWNNMGGGVNNMGTCLAKLGDYIYVGGVFTQSGGCIDTKHIAKYNMKSRTWHPLGKGLSSECCTLCPDETSKRLYVGGTFTHSGATELKYIGIYNSENETWERMVGGELNAPCRTLYLEQESRRLYAGGLFTSAGTEHTSYIAQYDMEESKWSPLSQGLQGYCNCICVHKKSLYAGGTFTCVGNNIAKYDIETKEWQGLQDGLNGICNTIVTNNRGQVYVGGSFTCDNENDEVLNRIAMFDINENKWNALDNVYNKREHETHHIGLDSVCKFLFMTEDNLYVVGSFQKAGNIDAGCIAKYKM